MDQNDFQNYARDYTENQVFFNILYIFTAQNVIYRNNENNKKVNFNRLTNVLLHPVILKSLYY